MGQPRRSFTPEFKQEAVSLCRRIFIALASYRPTIPPATSCPLIICVLVPQALHRVFAMNATHDLQLS